MNVTLNSTALVHEAWLNLKYSSPLASKSLPHFKAIAVQAMRQREELLALDAALEELARLSLRRAQIVESATPQPRLVKPRLTHRHCPQRPIR